MGGFVLVTATQYKFIFFLKKKRPQMGPMLLLRNAVDGLKWAQHGSREMLLMVSNGPNRLSGTANCPD
jgi:hypothetical protein